MSVMAVRREDLDRVQAGFRQSELVRAARGKVSNQLNAQSAWQSWEDQRGTSTTEAMRCPDVDLPDLDVVVGGELVLDELKDDEAEAAKRFRMVVLEACLTYLAEVEIEIFGALAGLGVEFERE